MSQTTLALLLSNETKVEDILKEMKEEGYSILDVLGAKQIKNSAKRETFICGKVLKRAVKKATKKTTQDYRYADYVRKFTKDEIFKQLNHYLPVEFHNKPKLGYGQPVIFITENPCFGETIRLAGSILYEYPFKETIILIDLNWYEALIPYLITLESIGIKLLPYISERTKQRILRVQTMITSQNIDHLSKKLFKYCLEESRQALSKKAIMILPFETADEEPNSESIKDKRSIIADFLDDCIASDVSGCSFVPVYTDSYRGEKAEFDVFFIDRLFCCEKLTATKIQEEYAEYDDLYAKLLTQIELRRLHIIPPC